MRPISQQIHRLKREEQILWKKCERSRNQAEIWRGHMRIAMNHRFAKMYADKAVKCEAQAERYIKKSMRVCEQWWALLQGKEN